MSEEEYMTEEENIQFYELLEKLTNSDDMAIMNIIQKAIELKQLIDEL
jgi:ABC-type Na+ transport system ATPase subunit NatA